MENNAASFGCKSELCGISITFIFLINRHWRPKVTHKYCHKTFSSSYIYLILRIFHKSVTPLIGAKVSRGLIAHSYQKTALYLASRLATLIGMCFYEWNHIKTPFLITEYYFFVRKSLMLLLPNMNGKLLRFHS